MKKPTLILALSICSGIAALGGCGQKGPLYLPVRPAAVSTPKPAAPAEAPKATAASASALEEKSDALAAPQK
ncbi:lipoprotein [Undibacterium sp.]|uniref:LPS translocon maturation chaperone LptM n=1 Tax=Undibacterium sp. TaxID=1914977 RepID=UPI0025D703F8|nr:lipoprotein [Undibacterium sp.]